MLPDLSLDESSHTPLYRQIADQLRQLLERGDLAPGDRLPPTRALSLTLNVNRATVIAAYEALESEGLIRSHVGRGSFVERRPPLPGPKLNWDEILASDEGLPAPIAAEAEISFALARPAGDLFPEDDFRATLRELAASPELGAILQLGAPAGYAPLRQYLLDHAREQQAAGSDDDILITSGVQQGFDLIQRLLASRGETVVIEDPVYPGLKNVFLRGGARVIGAPVGLHGLDIDQVERIFEREKPRLMLVTPNYQNPTGTSLSLGSRHALLTFARRHGVVLVENDLYSGLHYGDAAPAPIKKLDQNGDTVLLRSFSKIAFPGLRVGWVIGPRHFIGRLTEAKQWTDLHTDQLSQAALLRFAQSRRLEAHCERMRAEGLRRLGAALEACERYLPKGARFTRPTGGMNLWIRLPDTADAAALLEKARARGVSYLPGKYFAVSREETGSLRISFAGLDPARIDQGLRILGEVFADDAALRRAHEAEGPAPALV